MSDSLHTPLQLNETKETASQDKTPDDWFRSPTVKTLKRRQLQLGEANDDQFPTWFAHGANAQTVFNRPASSIQDLFAIPKSPSPDSPSSFLSNIHLRDKSTQELKIGSSGVQPTTSKPTTSLLHKLQLEKQSKQTNKRPLVENHSPPASKKVKDSDFNSQEIDEFGDDIPIEDLDALLAITQDRTDAAPQPKVAVSDSPQTFQNNSRSKRYGRFLIMEIHSTIYSLDDTSTQLPEKTLYLLEETDNTEHRVKLRDDWIHSAIVCGDLIHVICPNPREKIIVVDNKQNLLIIHPDTLISSTAVSDSFICVRRAVLRDRIRDTADYNEALVHGEILHKVFQSLIPGGDFLFDRVKAEMRRIVMTSVEELYAIDQSEEKVLLILERYIPGMQSWAATYLTAEPPSHATVVTDRGPSFGHDRHQPVVVGIEKVLDIEEHIWSPMYGIKGMIDVTVQAKVKKGLTTQTLTIPLEIKTGVKSKILAHRAQTILYTLLMHDRYGKVIVCPDPPFEKRVVHFSVFFFSDIDISAAILFYSKTNDVLLIPPLRNEVRGLIIGRNTLAVAFKDNLHLPPMIKNLHTCQRCYSVDACVVHHKSLERGTAQSSGLGQIFEDKTNHLNDHHLEFFRTWEELIRLEEGDIHRLRRDIWTVDSHTKEKSGRCWSHLEFIGKSNHPDDTHQNIYDFQRHRDEVNRAILNHQGDDDDEEVISNVTRLHGHISVGDPIVVSSEADHINLGMGFVTRIRKTILTVSLTRPFRGLPSRQALHFDDKENQTFAGVKDANTRDTTHYRIDKDEIAAGMGLVRNNLLTLFLREEDGGDAKRRRLIVDLEEPRFSATKEHLDHTPHHDLNTDQLRAADQVLNAQDYCLILGMPGTGKTTTIAHIIQSLVKQGKSILLTSYTHTAVDNVLSKVRDSGIDVLRIGNIEKVSPALHDCMPNVDGSSHTVQQLVNLYEKSQVVGTTCLGIGQ
ncbi:hypothetical protein K450DRAFT_227370 [Umbelopsis ramanniana AG]|uniref:DNA helicase n=1 Tax=Umbelopsis ramanniana AG TaxID=1314678 RepID=A0AAD5EEN7_UMBRA|nr:uncharacterized protein K450DRAFT_227370 [Umbelopsis ramanniana AG]KAI8582478.1 hypothetical protein K450DRAFT_227370 [Umbelopsis ramanniana AG]